MYKIVTLNANASENRSLENVFNTKYVQNCYFECKCLENFHLKMYLTPNMYKIVTLKANAKEIIT